MCAIGRALMANPSMVLLDEPSMGLAPQIVEEVFNIVKDLNTKEKVTFLLAEQNTNMALKYADYGYIMESGRVVMDGARQRPGQQRGRQGVLPGRGRRRAQELQGRQELQAAQALAGLRSRLWRCAPSPSGGPTIAAFKPFDPAFISSAPVFQAR